MHTMIEKFYYIYIDFYSKHSQTKGVFQVDENWEIMIGN